MFHPHLNWDRVPSKIKRAIETSLEHLDEQKFFLNDTNIESIDDYCWDLSKKIRFSFSNKNLICFLSHVLLEEIVTHEHDA